jgi:hypothetical protein
VSAQSLGVDVAVSLPGRLPQIKDIGWVGRRVFLFFFIIKKIGRKEKWYMVSSFRTADPLSSFGSST